MAASLHPGRGVAENGAVVQGASGQGGRVTSVSHCRACGAGPLAVVLSLGRTPLANALLDEADLARPEPTYDLDLALCRNCSLLQILESVPPEKLFREYCYFSSYSDTMLLHAANLA